MNQPTNPPPDSEQQVTRKTNSYFGFRLMYVLIAWVALGPALLESTTKYTLICPALLFLLPFCFDYHNPLRASKKESRRCEITFWAIVFAITILICLFISSYSFNLISDLIENLTFKTTLWLACLSLVGVAGFDFVVMSSPIERALQSRVAEISAGKNETTIPQKRVNVTSGPKKSKRKGRR
ncbi:MULTISPECIES: hypothetical protein [unclassified Exiguobacterium]|uniref:hypothetical protein n=1 Tax=unclassified Exiguobacterium TaxID=2644629 RepID=UPI0025BC276E|nr:MULTISPECIES: hypothetical protein [unclassified Exiguobacterium]